MNDYTEKWKKLEGIRTVLTDQSLPKDWEKQDDIQETWAH